MGDDVSPNPTQVLSLDKGLITSGKPARSDVVSKSCCCHLADCLSYPEAQTRDLVAAGQLDGAVEGEGRHGS